MCVRIVAAGNLSLSRVFCFFFFPLFFLDERRNGRSSNLGTHCSVSHGFFFLSPSCVSSLPFQVDRSTRKALRQKSPYRFSLSFNSLSVKTHFGAMADGSQFTFGDWLGGCFFAIEYFNINKIFDFYHQQLLPVD